MQVYIIGIGQCGTSVAYDVIANLTGFVKSKDVRSRPGPGGATAASNDLLTRMEQDLTSTNVWRAYVAPWVSRVFGLDATRGRKAFILPMIGIIDGNPDNFVKDAFGRFAHDVLAKEENEGNDADLKQLVALIGNTRVLGLGDWTDGCANSLVGEAVTTAKLPPAAPPPTGLRANLWIDEGGVLTQGDFAGFPVSVFLVVSSGGGATGSGGGVYLTKTGTLFSTASKRSQGDDGRNHALVTHAIVLPSLEASADNKKYALNAGRALARHCNFITRAGDGPDKEPSSVVLFSNPRDEGDPQALQSLNNYLSEFAIRVANFTYPGSVANIARDVDPRELRSFLSGKTCVLAMSHVAEELWGEVDLESTLVERALAGLYESNVDKPQGLSVESGNNEHDSTSVLATASSAMVVVGVPPQFNRPLKIKKIASCLKEYSGSGLNSGISAFAYGSAKHLEITAFLRYRTMRTCPLAMHFMSQYIDGPWDVDELPETELIRTRASRDEEDDEYAETFEGFAKDVRDLSGSLDFDAYFVRRSSSSRTTASLSVSKPETSKKPAENA